jgi:hypothetical protein
MQLGWLAITVGVAAACDRGERAPEQRKSAPEEEPALATANRARLPANDPCGAPPADQVKLPRGEAHDPAFASGSFTELVRVVSTNPFVVETVNVGGPLVFARRARHPVGALPPTVELAPGLNAPAPGDVVGLRWLQETYVPSPGDELAARHVWQVVSYAQTPLTFPRVALPGENRSGLVAVLDEGAWAIHVYADGGIAAWTESQVSHGNVPTKAVEDLLAAFRSSSFERMADVSSTAYTAQRELVPGTLARTCGTARAVRVSDDPAGLAPVVTALRSIYDAELAATELAIWAKPSGAIIPWPSDAPSLREMPFYAMGNAGALRQALSKRLMPPRLLTALRAGGLILHDGKHYRFTLATCTEKGISTGCVPDSYALVTLDLAAAPRSWPRPLLLATATGDRGTAVPASEPQDFYTFWDEEYADGEQLYRVHPGRRRR